MDMGTKLSEILRNKLEYNRLLLEALGEDLKPLMDKREVLLKEKKEILELMEYWNAKNGST